MFIQNYLPGTQWPHSWSLAIEEQFYLSLPLLLWLLRKRLHYLPLVISICVIAILTLRAFAPSWEQRYYFTHLRCDGLLFGVLLGYWKAYRPEFFQSLARHRYAMLSIPVMLIIAGFFPYERDAMMSIFGFTGMYVAFGSMVLFAGATPEFGQKSIALRLLARLGVYSYTIYLAHSVVDSIFGYRIVPAFAGQEVIFLIASVGLGILASRVIEQPMLRLRDQMLPSRRLIVRNAGATSD